MADMNSWWSTLSPAAKRNLAVGSIGTVVIAAIFALASFSPEVAKPSSKQATIQHILTDSDPRSLGIDGISAQLRDLLQKNDEQSRRLAAIEEQQKREHQSGEQRFRQWTEAEREAYDAKLKVVAGELETIKNKPAATVPSTENGATPTANGNSSSTNGSDYRHPKASHLAPENDDLNRVFEQASIPGSVANAGRQSGVSNGVQAGQNGQAPQPVLQIRVIKDEKAGNPAADIKTAADSSAKHSEVFIPAGTILTGVLLNGLDAPTGKRSKKEPMPVLFRIKKEAILPNRFHADLRECFLLASGFGDLSAERAYFRGETFSCVRQDGGVIEVPMNAYATGEDGKNGVRGRVISKQGALLAQAMMAGFLRGFSDAFGRNQIPMLMTGGVGSLSGTTPFQSAFSSQSMEGGSLRGAGYAMERLSHFYMDMAEEIYPVIEVDATRQVNFIVQKGTALKLKVPA
ncbi:TraB/VirB10 family protein [Methylomonas sp. AM2-LC]|uniref:TraB/VirB10 family protein n=1 Tax=Methylomonas sp. AM2-LC TaxID=3153301 RepID=UPI0032630AA2